MTELEALRKRVMRQRTELRRLNKSLRLLWSGWNVYEMAERESALRAKMNDAFGHEAVFEAEHGSKTPRTPPPDPPYKVTTTNHTKEKT